MYISKHTEEITLLALNQIEFNVIQKVIDNLIFNPENVSNQFKVTPEDVKVINQIRNNLNAAK